MDVQRQLKLIRKEVRRLDAFLTRIQMGSGKTDASGNAELSFPAPYPGTPFVFLQGVDAAARGIVLDVVSKSATGFTVKARKVTGLPTGTAIDNVHYSRSNAVTAIPAGTESGGADHTHDYSGTTGGPSATATPVTDVLYAANTGGPSATTSVASSGHRHQVTQSYGSMADDTLKGYFRFHTSAGLPGPMIPLHYVPLLHGYTATPSATTSVASSTHTHAMGLITVNRVAVASSAHTHDYSGTTGAASLYLHQHLIGAATTSLFVTSLTLLPGDYLTVVVGDPTALAVDFDFLAILR